MYIAILCQDFRRQLVRLQEAAGKRLDEILEPRLIEARNVGKMSAINHERMEQVKKIAFHQS